ncbi:MAG: hypothetical protein IJP36_05090, partial [Bacteroides sp.]|nr:hypothetical protein [Bacteroides sp.]
TLRQKKQYQRVALLFVCLLFAGLIILSLNSELAVTNENLNQTTEVLKDTQLRLTDSERMNSQQKEIIKENNKNIAVLKKQKQDLESQLDNAEDKIVQLNETITALDRTISSLKKQIPEYSNSNTFSYTSSNGNSDKIIKNPEIASKNSKSLTIKKIERTQNLTVIDFEYNNIYDASDWINIASDAYVVDSDTGKRYQMLEAYGIPKSPQKYTLKSVHETVNFSLVFPALPEKTRRINFIEYYNSSWNMYRIKLKD